VNDAGYLFNVINWQAAGLQGSVLGLAVPVRVAGRCCRYGRVWLIEICRFLNGVEQ